MTSFFAAEALLPEGWARDVLIEADAAGTITSVTMGAQPGGARRLGLVVPGLPNLHSHAFQRAMAGRADRRSAGTDSFWTWRNAMYAVVARMNPDSAEAVAAMLHAECLERGYTHLCEFHYLHHQPDGTPYAAREEMSLRHIAAAETSGIGLTLLPSLYRHGGIFGVEPNPGQRPFLNDLDQFMGMMGALDRHRGPRVALGVAPHSLRAVTPAMLQALDENWQGPIHLHLAEQRREVEECVDATGMRPAEWVLEHGFAGPRWVFIHATHLDDAEVVALGQSGSIAGLCPHTEASLGDGIFRLPEWLAVGGALGVGSDSQVSLDPAEELRQLETSQRLALEQRSVATSEAEPYPAGMLYRASLSGGARAAGAPIGAIAPGLRCDLVELDTTHPDLIDLSGDAALDAWVFGPGRGVVKTTLVAGRVLVEEGRHIAMPAIRAGYVKAMRDIWA
ncbi:formimidoylglutamate deiminase [Rhodovarius crocodyli]|uniref:Formimidoylglutamate deiminase n=1 Tax=Rhodovarius crocodyli TaxID=1979269 RepID=A0A437MEP4_9PROT|nr:formimidoylglutamate deiminase [Rhodovarius crocodyli]RVT96140.1 formimidoylglutamate deiminase [Rhodovarius crocodyli]